MINPRHEWVMLAVTFLDGRASGAQITEVLNKLNLHVSAPTVYQDLRQLRVRGFLIASVAAPRRKQGGKAHQVYEISETGRKYLAQFETARRQLRKR